MQRVFVAGATGYVGSAVVRQLAAAGARTRVVAHVRPDSPRLEAQREHFAALGAEVDTSPWQEPALTEALRRRAVTHVVCTVGTTRARAKGDRVAGDPYAAIDAGLTALLVAAARASGTTPRLIYLSSIGADPGSRSAYLRARAAAEASVAGSGLSYLIARPSFITGPDRAETRVVERVTAAIADGVLGLFAALGAGGPRMRYGSLSGEAVARALIALGIEGSEARVVEAPELRAAAGVAPAA